MSATSQQIDAGVNVGRVHLEVADSHGPSRFPGLFVARRYEVAA